MKVVGVGSLFVVYFGVYFVEFRTNYGIMNYKVVLE